MAGTTFALVPQLAGTRPLIRLPASGEVTVGRSAGAQIQLNAAFISRRHARLIAEAGRAYVVPLCRDDKLVTVNGVPAARGAQKVQTCLRYRRRYGTVSKSMSQRYVK